MKSEIKSMNGRNLQTQPILSSFITARTMGNNPTKPNKKDKKKNDKESVSSLKVFSQRWIAEFRILYSDDNVLRNSGEFKEMSPKNINNFYREVTEVSR